MNNWNKRGEKYLSVYWFAILVIVAVGISAMVIIFYGKPYDVREIEAGILINKIVDCLSNADGTLNAEINNENFLNKCHLVLGDEYYLEIDPFGIKQGNFNLKDYCGKGESVVCVKRNVYLLDEENREVIIKILSVVGKDA